MFHVPSPYFHNFFYLFSLVRSFVSPYFSSLLTTPSHSFTVNNIPSPLPSSPSPMLPTRSRLSLRTNCPSLSIITDYHHPLLFGLLLAHWAIFWTINLHDRIGILSITWKLKKLINFSIFSYFLPSSNLILASNHFKFLSLPQPSHPPSKFLVPFSNGHPQKILV